MWRMLALGTALAMNLMQPRAPGGGSQPQTLAAMRDQCRPLLVFAPSAADPSYQAQLRALSTAAEGMRDRQMQLVPLVPEQTAPGRAGEGLTILPAAEQAALRKRFGVSPSEFRVLLVGKDGGEKFSSAHPVPAETLFGLVDEMPMRQEELKKHGK